ncbi:MAG: DUF1566 domain-containing protein [Prevotellaceae bacterium]|nr:DUF1566 domain-containing protein [Prevotellaceae bacterium]
MKRNKTILLSALLALAATAFGQSSGSMCGYDYVDLGLRVKWATCNVGTRYIGEYGDYFAWGEAQTKSSYTQDNSETYGASMGDIGGSSSHDPARSNWGGSWRLPTKYEMDELVHRCQWKWTSMNGRSGYLVTGPNGNSIFLPAAGCRQGTSVNYSGNYGIYLTAAPFEGDTQKAYCLGFYSGGYRLAWPYRYDGFSVRAVTD